MPRYDWDGPASRTFRNAPDSMSLRVYVYRLCTKYGYHQVESMFRRVGLSCGNSLIRNIVVPLVQRAPLRHCPRCDQETYSQRICTTCSLAAERGQLTPRERERLRQHYAQANVSYSDSHDFETMYLEDDYTSEYTAHRTSHHSRSKASKSTVLLDRRQGEKLLV